MGLSAAQLREGIDAIAAAEPRFAQALATQGYPEPQAYPRGPATLMRAIVGQQVSVKAAASIWAKFEAAAVDPSDCARVAALDEAAMRACGFSRQKALYVGGLAQAVAAERLDFAALPEDDEAAVAALVALNGIGRWTAEIYLLFAEGRPDVFPAGDLAVQAELGRRLGEEKRPGEKRARELAARFSPHRGALATFLWHGYNTAVI